MKRTSLRRLSAMALALVVMCAAIPCASAQEVVDAILSAGTTQAFSQEAVSEEDLNAILQAGLSATSAINQQPWFFAVVTNSDVMAEISGSMGMGGAPSGAAPAVSGDSGEPAAEASAGTPAASGDAVGETGEEPPVGEGGEASAQIPASGGSAKAALGDSPAAVILYMDESTSSPNPSFDCGLACQNMVIAAAALGYGTKIISSPTSALNGDNHDALCELLGVDTGLTAVAVLLIGYPDAEIDGATGASTRDAIDAKVSFVR